jgi:hypothetical protein
MYSEPLEKFGGHFVDVQGGYGEELKSDDIDKPHFMFETRSCSNIFNLNLGDWGNLQYLGCMENGWARDCFSCH